MIGLLLAPAAAPPDDAALLRDAEAAFHAGVRAAGTPEEAAAYRRAADCYDELRRRGRGSPALYRNQGNAALLGDDLPQAILAYRRGLRLAPGDRDLQAGLAYARGQVLYPPSDHFARPPATHWPPGLPRPSLGTLLALTGFLYTLACLGLARWYMVRRTRPLAFGLILLVLACLPAAAAIYDYAGQVDAVEHPIVVIATDNVLLRRGNGPSYSVRSDLPLNRGVEAQLLHHRSGWLMIELASGEVGWVSNSVALVDE
jgi:hypothetical protein